MKDNKQIVVCDIDGCLNDYPIEFLRWVKLHYGYDKENLDSLKTFLKKDKYEKLKHAYRTSGVKRNLTVRDGAVSTIEEIRKLGKEIWVLTTRPAIEPVKSDTEYWLKRNGLVYDKLEFLDKERKRKFIRDSQEKICFIIEDNYEIARYTAQQLKILVFFFGNKRDNCRVPTLVTLVKNWHEIMKTIETKLNDMAASD